MFQRSSVAACLLLGGAASPAQDWPWWRGPHHDGVWNSPASFPESFPGEGLPTVWRQAIGGGYSGITISEGRVFTLDRPEGREEERVLCFSLETGAPLWEHRYSADYGDLDYGSGPRASVTLSEGRAYALGATGQLHCLEASSGRLLWSVDTPKELGARQPTWGFAASPLVWRDLLILHLGAEPDGCYVALDRLSGAPRWRSGSDAAGYSTPVPVQHRGRDLLLCWTPLHLCGLDPRDGRVLWRIPYEVQYGVSIADPVLHGDIVFIAGYWHGSRAVRLGEDPAEATLLWSREDLCGLMAQPLFREPYLYLLERSRGLSCVELETGRTLWEDESHLLTPGGRNPQASLVAIGDSGRALALNSNGELVLLELRPEGYAELSRAQLIGKTWAHPAFSDTMIVARSDREILCARFSLQPTQAR
ncbi:MAG TPA: PQQ-binding-like beta-propeller repeat protein [Verrucomicrobiales bacterium]|nr:PQQ-binding-like beta-propeller repeat protein [Verrucomicrobiales bacterium]